MKHKHYDIICAKAANMDLVVFVDQGSRWVEYKSKYIMPFDEEVDYFLCLPQHKEAALNVLNGGESEVNYGDHWQQCNLGKPVNWQRDWWCMSDNCESRIKPKKEKRWIIAKPKALASMVYFHSYEDAKNAVNTSTGEFTDGQVIEIEINV